MKKLLLILSLLFVNVGDCFAGDLLERFTGFDKLSEARLKELKEDEVGRSALGAVSIFQKGEMSCKSRMTAPDSNIEMLECVSSAGLACIILVDKDIASQNHSKNEIYCFTALQAVALL